MKYTVLASAISVALIAAPMTSHAMFGGFSNFTQFSQTFTEVRQREMFSTNSFSQTGPFGSIGVTNMTYESEYQYVHQEIQMASLANYVSRAAPGFGAAPSIGSGGNPAASGCDANNPFDTSCDPDIATDPSTGTTVATYPNGNALYMQGSQVFYEYQYQKVQFASTEYTMNNFCSCAMDTGASLSNYTSLRQTGYSYESVRQYYHSTSYQIGYQQSGFGGFGFFRRGADDGLMMTPVDAATDAMLEQAKQAVAAQ